MTTTITCHNNIITYIIFNHKKGVFHTQRGRLFHWWNIKTSTYTFIKRNGEVYMDENYYYFYIDDAPIESIAHLLADETLSDIIEDWESKYGGIIDDCETAY